VTIAHGYGKFRNTSTKNIAEIYNKRFNHQRLPCTFHKFGTFSWENEWQENGKSSDETNYETRWV